MYKYQLKKEEMNKAKEYQLILAPGCSGLQRYWSHVNTI